MTTTTNIPSHDTSGHAFFNRELSWLEFNARVLEEALMPSTPLLERLKFLTIFSSNLDEFFMVRVAGLKKLIEEELVDSESPNGIPPREVLSSIKNRTEELLEKQYRCLLKEVLPELARNGVRIVSFKELSESERSSVNRYYSERVFPVLTPLAVDPPTPFLFSETGHFIWW